MKILVTGHNGQVARALRIAAPRFDRIDIATLARPEVDLSIPGSVSAAIREREADMVVNAAAFTAVDAAESEEALAYRINRDGAGEAAAAAASIGAGFIQLSTDYAFDGRSAPYREEDRTGPVNVYGRSKLAGEDRVRELHPSPLVVRTSWVVSPWEHNFVRTMLRLAEGRDEISVVNDQFGCPTSAEDLADAILTLVLMKERLPTTLHLSGSGEASWAMVAEEIFRASAMAGGPSARVVPIASSQYRTRALRPTDTRLDCSRARDLGIDMPDWRASLRAVVDAIMAGPRP